jgi:hypothetical protein
VGRPWPPGAWVMRSLPPPPPVGPPSRPPAPQKPPKPPSSQPHSRARHPLPHARRASRCGGAGGCAATSRGRR